jgi:streptomycin 3"-adenylyltransferase
MGVIMNDKTILDNIKSSYQVILGDNLVGIYVHGSIAMNCFHWNSSDIDYIVVIEKELSEEQKLRLMQATVEQNETAPAKGIEMSVVLARHCREFRHPTPFELHFSNMHLQWFREDPLGYCKNMKGEDPDLAAHFTIINKYGIVLYGKEIAEIFSKVPKEAYLDSIKADIEEAASLVMENPVYIILNLCRVAAYASSGLVLSKEQGGVWGMEHLEAGYHPLIQSALQCYRSGEKMFPNSSEAEEYCKGMLEQIH